MTTGKSEASLTGGLSNAAVAKLNQMSMAELLGFLNLQKGCALILTICGDFFHVLDATIPVANSETASRVDIDKCPKLSNLDEWLRLNPKHSVDLLALAALYPEACPPELIGLSAAQSKKKDVPSENAVIAASPSSIQGHSSQFQLQGTASSSKIDLHQKPVTPATTPSETPHRTTKKQPTADVTPSVSSNTNNNDMASFLANAAAFSQFMPS